MEVNKNNCLLAHIHGRISSVSRVVDCRVGGHGSDSQGRTNTWGLKKLPPLPCKQLDLCVARMTT